MDTQSTTFAMLPYSKKLKIRFLHEFESNFLIAEPRANPMLLEHIRGDGNSIEFLPKGIVAMLVGAGGVGKTHLLSQLAISIATGTPFLKTFTTTRHCGEGNKGNVFIGLGENQYNDIHGILHRAAKELRKTDLGLLEEASRRIAPFSFCGQQAAFLEYGSPSRYFRALKMHLESSAPKDGWSLVILDPVSRLLGVDAEKDKAAATQFITLLEELAIELPGNPTILCAHHVDTMATGGDKAQYQTFARGTSALTDGVRWQANFIRPWIEKSEVKDIAILKMTKSNFTAILDEIKIKRGLDGFLERFFDAKEPMHATKASQIKKECKIQDVFSGRVVPV